MTAPSSGSEAPETSEQRMAEIRSRVMHAREETGLSAGVLITNAAGMFADFDWLLARLSSLEAENAKLLHFAGAAMKDTRDGELGDWDGGSIQDAAVACGLLASHEVTEPCGANPEGCHCSDYGFPTTCYRYTDLAHNALSAVAPPQGAPAT